MSRTSSRSCVETVGRSQESIAMQVFTTIFLAETLRANVECIKETPDLDQNLPGAVEFKNTLQKRIAMLERRGFFESDETDD